jgi:hypothetical protein
MLRRKPSSIQAYHAANNNNKSGNKNENVFGLPKSNDEVDTIKERRVKYSIH